MDLDSSDLISGFIGAVLGGVLAIVGGVWVNRREIIREARTHIYQELLPPLLEQRNHRAAAGLRDRLMQLVRTGPRTTRGDRRIIDRLWKQGIDLMNSALRAVKEQSVDETTGKMRGPDETEHPFQELSDGFLAEVRAFDERLRGRIL